MIARNGALPAGAAIIQEAKAEQRAMASVADRRSMRHSSSSPVECRELSERALDRDGIDTGVWRGDIETVDWDGRLTRATLRRLPHARSVDEHPPHHLGGGAEEVPAVPPFDVAPAEQPQVRLTDQIGRLLGTRRRPIASQLPGS